jgi:hypothetical protein
MLQRIDGTADKLAGWVAVWLDDGAISLLAQESKQAAGLGQSLIGGWGHKPFA